MFFKPTHMYVKIRKNAVWAKHLETQSSIDLVSPEPFKATRLLVGEWNIAVAATKSAIRNLTAIDAYLSALIYSFNHLNI